ncbi:uncharacterized protein MYCFIDRAFT_179071 [Pseudocercospora fijiensis CIRAD86]|uniref:Uncharacterized protein n=1 Tax=Pseudocercospora fijiensis (strain CIRAD86) TaxID=383855 RepID=M2ZEI9_PSEFD|nr:uncharacterized protein MYCFIDRAFT_179071 [Pseudocercospora fijiensis CIRAD86]EME77554.1 hypothetical protein MYCFIDRAFT_179071 [Pseudocercospora fijiensis CIRAD86]
MTHDNRRIVPAYCRISQISPRLAGRPTGQGCQAKLCYRPRLRSASRRSLVVDHQTASSSSRPQYLERRSQPRERPRDASEEIQDWRQAGGDHTKCSHCYWACFSGAHETLGEGEYIYYWHGTSCDKNSRQRIEDPEEHIWAIKVQNTIRKTCHTLKMSSINANEGYTYGQMQTDTNQIAPSTPLVPDGSPKMVLPADPGSTEAAANIISGKRQRKPTARALALEQDKPLHQARPLQKPSKVVKRPNQNTPKAKAKASPPPKSPAKKKPSPRLKLRNPNPKPKPTPQDLSDLLNDPKLSPKSLSDAYPEEPDLASRVRRLQQDRRDAGVSPEEGAELAVLRFGIQRREKEKQDGMLEAEALHAAEILFEMSRSAWSEGEESEDTVSNSRTLSMESEGTISNSRTLSRHSSEDTISDQREVSTEPSCRPMPEEEEEEEESRRNYGEVGSRVRLWSLLSARHSAERLEVGVRLEVGLALTPRWSILRKSELFGKYVKMNYFAVQPTSTSRLSAAAPSPAPTSSQPPPLIFLTRTFDTIYPRTSHQNLSSEYELHCETKGDTVAETALDDAMNFALTLERGTTAVSKCTLENYLIRDLLLQRYTHESFSVVPRLCA